MTASTFIQAEDFEDRLFNPHDLFLMKDDRDVSAYLSKLSKFELQEFYSFDKGNALDNTDFIFND